MDDAADVVVLGAGIAGLAAAISAAERGCSVLVLEKAPSPGGSAAMSGGTLWTGSDYDELMRVMPEADAALLRALVDGFAAAVDWMAQQGVALEQARNPPPYRVSRWVWTLVPTAAAGIASLVSRLEALGGRLVTSAAAMRLVQDAAGRIEGVSVWASSGGLRVRSSSVVIATGGFQGNPELLTRYMGRWADRMALRSNPYSTGDGLLMAMEAGAATSRGLHTFYGHLVPAPPARLDPPAFTRVTPYFSEHTLIVNLNGHRFTDESLGDEVSAQEAVRQRDARAVVLFDERVHREQATVRSGAEFVDRVAAIRDISGPVVEAPTLDELVQAVGRWGVHEPGLVRTLRAYHEAAETGTADRLPVPRRANAHVLRQPPFFGLLMRPGITFTTGGLRVDTSARVLARNGVPLPGLFAAGADAGGVFYDGYAGGLALGLVFGRIAGRSAAELARATSDSR